MSPTTIERPEQPAADLLSTLAHMLAQRLSDAPSISAGTLAQALHQVLDGQEEGALRVRNHLQQHLLMLSEQEILQRAEHKVHQEQAVAMLTTQQAADLMGCSRPHVAMLIDAGCLPGAVRTPKGHRRVPESSVLQWLQEHPPQAPVRDSEHYRLAARESLAYNVSESDVLRALQERTAP